MTHRVSTESSGSWRNTAAGEKLFGFRRHVAATDSMCAIHQDICLTANGRRSVPYYFALKINTSVVLPFCADFFSSCSWNANSPDIMGNYNLRQPVFHEFRYLAAQYGLSAQCVLYCFTRPPRQYRLSYSLTCCREPVLSSILAL